MAIVWCRYAGGGGTAITLGDSRGARLAAVGDALAELAAARELFGGAAVFPAEQPAASTAATAAASATGRRPWPLRPGRTSRGW
jgi:hypothetical protein